jgi:hypothetical protein
MEDPRAQAVRADKAEREELRFDIGRGRMQEVLQGERQQQQIPLIHIVFADDEILLQSPDAEWFQILKSLPWESYRMYAAEYYDALYAFNLGEAAMREQENREQEEKGEPESKEEAKQRILWDRATMRSKRGEEDAAVLQKRQELEGDFAVCTDPQSLAPGVVPFRFAGRTPKCFFAMFKSFLGATLMGFPPEPESVFHLLGSNPAFLRVCGFTPAIGEAHYCGRHMPSVRKLQQFDQIMTDTGIWGRIKLEEVRGNLKSGLIRRENELVADTTHYYAYSSFETVRYVDEEGKEQKKSQSKLTKNCRCADWSTCRHEWQQRDEGAGTIVKSNNKMYWGHKASVVGYPRQGIPLDVAAVADAATFDGKTLYPHVRRLFEELPEIKGDIKRVLYDSACDDEGLKRLFRDELGIELKASMNPRRRSEITEGLPRGMEKLTPYGEVVCGAGHEMEYQGMRIEKEKFIYGPPLDVEGISLCLECERKMDCCPRADTGRTITLAFSLLPHIDPNDPPMAKRFKAIMTRRPSVERMIKRLKKDLGDDRLSKRGNASFQASLDKTMIAFHILLRK